MRAWRSTRGAIGSSGDAGAGTPAGSLLMADQSTTGGFSGRREPQAPRRRRRGPGPAAVRLEAGGSSISTEVSPPTLEQYVGIVEALADEADQEHDQEHDDGGETMH